MLTTLQLGKEANAYLNGNKKLLMDFRLASPRKSRATKGSTSRISLEGQARLVPLAQRKLATTKTTTALSRKRSRQEVLENEQGFVGSDDDPDWDPIEDADRDGDDRYVEIVESPPKRPRRSAVKTQSASEQCLDGLRKLRTKVSSMDATQH